MADMVRRLCRPGALGAALLLLILLATRAQGEEAVQVVRSDDGKCSVEVPAAWRVTPETPKSNGLLRFRAVAEGVDEKIVVNVWLLQGQRDVLRQASLERDFKGRDPGTVAANAETDPFPHLVLRLRDKDGEWIEVTAYAMARRNGVNTQISCDVASWPALRGAFLHMARSLRADVDEWPPHPSQLQRQPLGGVIYLVHPSVKSSDMERLQALVARVARDFEASHGKIILSEENLPLVVIYNSLAEARSLSDELKGVDAAATTDILGGRIFLTPVPVGRGRKRADCSECVVQLLYIQRYGFADPYWMYVGEGRAAWSEEAAGLHIPRVATSVGLPSAPLAFSEVVRMENGDGTGEGTFHDNATAYVLFFRAGPARYRKAYEAFKAELAATRDVRRATETHLLSLDQDVMKADLERWLRRSVQRVAEK
jgi:hypothetical protein